MRKGSSPHLQSEKGESSLKHNQIGEAMSIREGERPRKRISHKGSSLSDLAIDIVGDDPESSKTKLARRMQAQIEGDPDLLDKALEQVTLHEVTLAINYFARKAGRKRKGDDREKEKELSGKAVMKLRELVLNFNSELGKKIGNLSGYEVLALVGSNATRTNLYTEISKRVKRDQLVSETLQEEQFRAILKRIGGDVKEMGGLFR